MYLCTDCIYAVIIEGMEISGLRERKKVETRRTIIDVALRLAVERGPNHVTVEDIAAAAGVSPRTVFNYFGTKDEAILGIDSESRIENVQNLRSRPPEEPPLVSLHVVLRDRITTVDKAGEYWRTRAQLVRDHPQLRAAQVAAQLALEHDLSEVIAERCGLKVAEDLYPSLVVSVALAALRLALGRPASAQLGGLRDEIDTAFRHLADGFQK